MARRIVLVEGLDKYFLLNRAPLGMALLRAGFEVWVVAAESGAADRIRDLGFSFQALPGGQRRRSWLGELQALVFFWRLYRRLRPLLVHHFTLRPVLFGSLAAHILGIAVVNSITGLGYVFTEPGRADRLRVAVSLLYRVALSRSLTIVQNPDDQDFILKSGWTVPSSMCLIPGSGVDCERFAPTPEPTGGPIKVVLPGRILRDKGVLEFVEAARLIAEKTDEVRMVLVGDTDPAHPTSLSEQEIRSWEAAGLVHWAGFQSDMPAVFSSSHVIALPSYREGYPKALLEACACQRAVIGADVPGVREVVIHEKTGLLVQARDAPSLADAILRLASDSELRARLAAEGRRLALSRSAESIVEAILGSYRSLGIPV